MFKNTLRIATRKSPLALWQAEHVAARLVETHPGLKIQLCPFVTKGDILLDTPLAKIGGKGLFIKELERALLDEQADIAVHSMKDLPAELPDDLQLAVVLKRGSHKDALVSNHYNNLNDLPKGARIGSSSLRRQAQLLAHRPDFVFGDLRGNLNTRLAKLDAGEYDAIILATAGLHRLDMPSRVAQQIPTETCLPAAGQGIMGIECRADKQLLELIKPLQDVDSWDCLMAERSLNAELGGSCQLPVGAYAELKGQQLFLRGLLASPNGQHIILKETHGDRAQAQHLGEALGQQILNAGGREILQDMALS